MTTAKAPNDAARLRLVEKDVDRHERAIRTNEGEVAAAKETAATALRGVATLTAAVEGVARRQRATPAAAVGGDEDQAEAMPCWLTLADPDKAQQTVGELVEWLESVYLRYPGGHDFPGGDLTECWLWHPSVVEELLACRAAWYAAYEGDRASARAVMDWHDRDRVGTARRVRDELAGCSLTKHKADGPLAYRPARAPGMEMATEVVEWWAKSQGGTAAPPPNASMLATERAKMTDRN